MNLIELSEELSIEDIVELLARKALHMQQDVCKSVVDDEDQTEAAKQPYRDALQKVDEMASSTRDVAHEIWFHNESIESAVCGKIDELAGEYVRTI